MFTLMQNLFTSLLAIRNVFLFLSFMVFLDFCFDITGKVGSFFSRLIDRYYGFGFDMNDV